MSKNDFQGDEYEFAAGSILGMRSWQMDAAGRLTGVTHRTVWLPGENVATCRKTTGREPCPERTRVLTERAKARPASDWTTGGEAVRFEVGLPTSCGDPTCWDWTHPAPSTHAFDPDCECGFWAYNEHDFQDHGAVTGIIAGYGKTTIGTRGFRCEKAKIIALCRENDDEILSLSAWLRLQQLYPDAQFYDDQEDMVTAHGAVLKDWAPVDEGFWERDTTPDPVDLYTSLWFRAIAGGSAIPPGLSRRSR